MSAPDEEPCRPLAALYLSVEDVDAAYALWKERGVEMVSEPWDAPFGRTFAFKDADGRIMHAYVRVGLL